MADKYWAICPNCGTNIDYSSFTYDDYDENEVYFKGAGKCPDCGKKWEWEEKFIFSEICFFKEILREDEDCLNLDF